MRKGQTHPSSITSKNMLAQGLVGLLREEEYKDITITKLCDHAQIARRTFYRNFETIEDVLAYSIAGIMGEFVKELNAHVYEDLRTVATVYFAFWEKHARLLLLLSKNNLIHIVFTQYIHYLHQFPKTLWLNGKVPPDEGSFAVRLAYISGGLWSVLTYWISSGCQQCPSELAGIISGE
ncbi:TetR family transcriptional regulator [Fontibacillus phaseoli]|uniref:TetR family transcriptional regulator n=1 Tax=Fontibacillus phaseoli TaxID=1416533 RepID=A0A369BDE1_9BACL|nr:TetR/AcrR family transcriptional regulator [Fontibacillus phaseoli]RCX18606.1 TetR family transcriptional regulator [Fontibacillus phaseoli]